MIVHLAMDGVMEGALGLGLDVVDTAARLLRAGRSSQPPSARSLEQRVVSHDGRPVPSVQRRSIAVEGAFDPRALKRGDVVVLPGVFATKDSSIDRLLGRADVRRILPRLAQAARRGAIIAASCSATFFLGAAGLLDGRRATTTWWLMPFFQRRFPAVELQADRMVVDDGAIITAGSAFAHADLLLRVVARASSPTLAALAASYLVLDQRASQARYMVLDHLHRADPLARSLEQFVQANLSRQLSLAELARAVGTSPRTLARRLEASVGTTPRAFVQRLRVAHATHLLDTTRASVEEVATRVGCADATTLRRMFRRYTGSTPRGRTRARDAG